MQNLGSDDISDISGVEQRHFTVEEALGAREVMLTSSSLPVMPVVEWDGKPIDDGKAGGMTLALRKLLLWDAEPREDSEQHVAVPYGFMTFMGGSEELQAAVAQYGDDTASDSQPDDDGQAGVGGKDTEESQSSMDL